MDLRQIAIVSESPHAPFEALGPVSAALQKQAVRDLGPAWQLQATVHAFARLEDVPVGYWPIILRDDIHAPGAAGVHEDDAGQPFALVQVEPGWSLTASHELVEMLVDPYGNRLAAGQSPKTGQGRVEFLVEPCDPCEAAQFAYLIDGVLVSDFYTPRYFATAQHPGERYSHTGALSRPRQVLEGGYLSWHDPVSGHWFQQVWFGRRPAFRDLGPLSSRAGTSFRRQIYDLTREALAARRTGEALDHATLALQASHLSSTHARAFGWRRRIEQLLDRH
ncbi:MULTISPECIES: hypothetical protein [Ramlibacter]|uniref:Uncharacterized protein n=1 Tax=Ramlibacter aquaticus TaxID=2780094 RepID=A0ABR9SDN2_9BURK|nr:MULTISPECIES: hypothetical protein [Ramlibacter]MBE7940463.1 hypothetical protein [Ramlibacter aquaticus]